MNELEACPFCGSEAEYWLDAKWDDKHVIECQYCGCSRRYEYSKEGVVKKWNHRPLEASLKAETETNLLRTAEIIRLVEENDKLQQEVERLREDLKAHQITLQIIRNHAYGACKGTNLYHETMVEIGNLVGKTLEASRRRMEGRTMEAITYKELMEILRKLTPEQKQQKVRVGLESTSGFITDLWVAKEPYVNPTGEGIEPISGYNNKDYPKDEWMEESDVVVAKGTLLLSGYEPHLSQVSPQNGGE